MKKNGTVIKGIIPIIDSYESEILTEDFPGHYVDCRDFDYGVYDYDSSVKLPESAIQIRRYCRGAFLIVVKSGPYNSINSTYVWKTWGL